MRIRNRFLIKLIGRVGIGTVRTALRTCRFHIVGDLTKSVYHEVPDRFLYATWHESIVAALLVRPTKNLSALVSRHADGDWVTSMLDASRIKPVRGSTSRGGAAALREMLEVTKNYHVAITPDGPRGPHRVVKPGVVYIASKTGNVIVPASYGCTNQWSCKGNWTDLAIPKPFSTVYCVSGEPLSVPPDLDREGIEHYTAVLQAALVASDERAAAYARGEKPDVDRPAADERPSRAAA